MTIITYTLFFNHTNTIAHPFLSVDVCIFAPNGYDILFSSHSTIDGYCMPILYSTLRDFIKAGATHGERLELQDCSTLTYRRTF